MSTYVTNFLTFSVTSNPNWDLLTGPQDTTWSNTADGDNSLEVGETWSTATGDDFTYQGYKVIDFNGESVILLEMDPGGAGTSSYFAQVSDPNAFETFLEADPSLLDNATQITNPLAVCFAAGTLIATPGCERAVETLEIGDLVTTADGRAVPVKWIGRQTLHKLFAGERARPVRVAAGALGEGLPHTDLVLTADHALILDGLAINAGALVNGTTITLEPLAALPERVTYYHVETEAHDVILANGTPAETFIDYVGRQAFDNHAEYVELYGDARIITEMPLPRISTARLVPPALKARLAGEAAA